MATQAQKRLFTVAEYYKMAEVGILAPDARVELINGEIIEMSPIKSNHAGHVRRFSTLLNEILLRKVIIDSQNPLHINAYSEPQPDIMVLKWSPDFYTSRHPKPEDVYLLIEVADSSLRYDRETKLPLYAQAGVTEVWIVNLKKRCIEQYHQPKNDKYALHEVAQEEEVLHLPYFDIKIEASEILG